MEDFELQDLCVSLIKNNHKENQLINYNKINESNTMQYFVDALVNLSESDTCNHKLKTVNETKKVDSIFGGNTSIDNDDDDEEDDEDKNSEDTQLDSDNDDTDENEEENEEENKDEEENEDEDETSSLDFTATNSTDDISKISDFGINLLFFATQAHFWHLNCEKNIQHVTLQDLYEKCEEYADKILESVIGITNAPCKPTMSEFDCGDLVYDESCISKIEKLKESAQELLDCEYEGINNVLGDLCELCDEVIYKLKRLG